jgi:hypothetical protein
MHSLRTGQSEEVTSYTLRAPCSDCGASEGYLRRVGLQDTVYCVNGTYQYNAPRTETGERPVSLSDRNGLTPGQRKRILATYGHACFMCGARPPDVQLHIDHIISRKAAQEAELLDELIDSEDNYAPLCASCNSGKRDSLDISLVIRALTIRYRIDQ